MSIEPYAVRFQVGTRVLPKEVRTPEDYRENLKRKFGKIPSMAEMVRMENKNVYRSLMVESKPLRPLDEAGSARLVALKDRAAQKTRATLGRILACLTEPKTSVDIAQEVGLSAQGIGSHLRAALDRGEVCREMAKRVSIWSKP